MESKGVFQFAHVLYLLAFIGYLINLSEGYSYVSETIAIVLFLVVLFATDFIFMLNEKRESVLNTTLFKVITPIVYLVLLLLVSYQAGNYTMFLILLIFFMIDRRKSAKSRKQTE